MNNRKLVLAFKTFLAEAVKWALSPPAKPGAFALVVTGEEITGPTVTLGHDGELVATGVDVMKKNITTITLPPVADGNPEGVAVRKFEVKSGEVSLFKQDLTLPEGAVNVDPIVVKLPQGVETTLTLVDEDAAGNDSEPDVFVFTPTDVTPPSQPGEFALSVSGEVDEA